LEHFLNGLRRWGSLSAYNNHAVYQSTNGGSSWKIVLNAKQGQPLHSWGIYQGLAIDPADPDIVYVAPNDAKGFTVLKSVDGGESWEKKGRDWLGTNNRFRMIKVAPGDASVLYIIAGKKNNTPGKVYKSFDQGESWELLENAPMADPRDIWIDPNDSDHVMVASSDVDANGGVYASTDGGDSWQPVLTKTVGASTEILAEVEANAGLFGCNGIASDPKNPNILYATGGTVGGGSHGDYKAIYGMFRSTDGGTSWQPFAREIKYGRLAYITVSPHDSDILYVGSYGAGGFRIDISELAAGVEDNESEIPASFSLLQNYPNPFNPETTISYRIDTDNLVSLTIYDVLGKKVRTVIKQYQSAGSYEFQWDGSNDAGSAVGSGVYLCRLNCGGKVEYVKMTVLR